MRDKKGFTTIELVTTFALTMVIVVLLMQIIVVLKDVYVERVVTTNLRVKQGLMTEKIMDDFDNKTMKGTTGCTDPNCITFVWEDGTSTKLSLDTHKNTFTYGDYSTTLTQGSSFGTISVTNSLDALSSNIKYLSIDIPVSSSITKGDYGIKVVY